MCCDIGLNLKGAFTQGGFITLTTRAFHFNATSCLSDTRTLKEWEDILVYIRLRKRLLYIQCFTRAGKGTFTTLSFRVLILMTNRHDEISTSQIRWQGVGEKNVDHHCINFQWSFCDASRSKTALLSSSECYCIAQAGVSSHENSGSYSMTRPRSAGTYFQCQEPGHNLGQNHLDSVPVRQHSLQPLALHNS